MKRWIMIQGIKLIIFSLFLGVAVYSVTMIVVRLQMTELAYRFEAAKKDERSLQEEQMRLRSELARLLNPKNMKVSTLQEPGPNQVRVIP
jgi:hypothetical protein